jgi:protoporphyrinogen oxidase
VKKVVIIGAGVSGLSASYHLGHDKCEIYEAQSYYGGHCYSEVRDGVVWDDGPHVAWGKNMYVHDVYAEAVDQDFQEFVPVMGNYYRGHWIGHPAQSHLYQIPEPLRTQCLNSFMEARNNNALQPAPANYQEWLYQAFGRVFADTFPSAYTRKYWTTEPINLGTDWLAFPSPELPRRTEDTLNTRVYYPKVEDIKDGAYGPLGQSTHYVTRFRYPSRGGFVAFFRKFADGARIRYGKSLTALNFRKKQLRFLDGTEATYDILVSTIPLPNLLRCSEDAPADIKEAGSVLRCTNFLLVNVAANHPTKRKEHWLYVYDEDKLSTRINFTERFSPYNAPPSTTGIAVEVYGSEYRPLPTDHDAVARRVQSELVEMDLLESLSAVKSVHVRFVPTGNPIFDHNRQPALNKIFPYLDSCDVICLGRYAEWEYLMTHDCVMASRQIAEKILAQI